MDDARCPEALVCLTPAGAAALDGWIDQVVTIDAEDWRACGPPPPPKVSP